MKTIIQAKNQALVLQYVVVDRDKQAGRDDRGNITHINTSISSVLDSYNVAVG